MFAKSRSSFPFSILMSQLIQGIASSSAVFLTSRGEGESAWDPLEQNILDGIGAFGSSVWDSILGSGFSVPSIADPPTVPTVPDLEKKPQQVQGAQQDPVSPNEPELQTAPWKSEECNDSPPVGAPDELCDKKVGIKRIIFSRDCGNQDQNAATAVVLAQTVEAGTEISTTVDDDCGVIFWTGKLTEEGADYLRSKDGVLGVEDDVPVELAGETASAQSGSFDHEAQKRDTNGHERRSGSIKNTAIHHLQRRDTIIVQDPLTTSESLAFVSSAPGYPVSHYVYYSAAGEDITVYVIDSGANPTNSEFTSGVIKRWIYAYDCVPLESDLHLDGHGSCVASKVAGVESGVAKKASLVIVKAMPEMSSSLDAFVKVLNDLRQRQMDGESLPGYNVLNISWTLRFKDGGGGLIIDKMRSLVSKMIMLYGLVIVCSSLSGPRTVGQFNFPSSLSDYLPIIVVGAADSRNGKTLSWSSGDPLITVTAPGLVLCAGLAEGLVTQTGSSFAAPTVTGLAAYFLSLDDVGPMLRKAAGRIPQAVKDYIVTTAYIRPRARDRAIWNGLQYDGP